ncbi:MAG: regulatory iron-sulfur-containing complex subunit RicT [Chloroflexota bacterium]|mgnify:CR=1 FL=1|nr:regulatory iron-sulfur-containing complex subunit RicT [Aggregatilineaceae bacterium]
MTLPIENQLQAVSSALAAVRFQEVGKLYYFGSSHLPDLLPGDFVIVETARGVQMGQVMKLLSADHDTVARDYKPILRKATPADMMSQKLWKAREVEALIVCREKAAEIGGYANAKFVAAQYNFDGSLLTFLFSAEDKINTTRLRLALRRNFKAQIDLRQIGPRDVAKLLGGLGACGIPRCCSTFLTDFSPISIKMAKAQGISLNPSEITGMCGRLRCCLIYEYEQYVEARKQLPKRNKRIGTPHGEGKVIDVHPLSDAVTVLIEETRYLVQREDIVPLDEFEALKAKAEAGCSKHESGGCDCGAQRGAASAEADTGDDADEDDLDTTGLDTTDSPPPMGAGGPSHDARPGQDAPGTGSRRHDRRARGGRAHPPRHSRRQDSTRKGPSDA